LNNTDIWLYNNGTDYLLEHGGQVRYKLIKNGNMPPIFFSQLVPWRYSEWELNYSNLNDSAPNKIYTYITLPQNIYKFSIKFSQQLYDKSMENNIINQDQLQEKHNLSNMLSYAQLWMITFIHEFFGHYRLRTHFRTFTPVFLINQKAVGFRESGKALEILLTGGICEMINMMPPLMFNEQNLDDQIPSNTYTIQNSIPILKDIFFHFLSNITPDHLNFKIIDKVKENAQKVVNADVTKRRRSVSKEQTTTKSLLPNKCGTQTISDDEEDDIS